jgi:S1-C subfamily serine protease
MSRVRALLGGISAVLLIAGALLVAPPPARADYAFSNAEAAFQRELLEDRLRLQLLLAAGGYLNSVPMAEFSRHAYAGIQAFQADNGFPSTGEIESNPDEIARLRRIGGEMLDFWGFAVIQHPNSPVRLWIPGNLGLNRHATRYGYDYDDPAKRISIQYYSFPNLNVVASFRSTLRYFAENNAYINYKVAKDDWYVVSASTPDGQDWYVRYHRDGSSTTGFTLAWNNANGNIHGERIATLMSASLWSDRTGAPILTPWQLRAGRPPSPQPDVASRQVEAPPQPTPEKTDVSTGTGFFVDDGGDLLTNNHVIEDCSDIKVRMPDKTVLAAKAIAHDAANDLALLKVDGVVPKAAPFRPDVKLGEPVAAFGFPHADIMSSSGSFTLGSVTSMSGLHDDSRYVQISAPVQSGNSGGPLFDYDGNTIGMVSAKLNALKMAIATDDLPQNVNFAIKGYVIASFLDANKVKTTQPQHREKPLQTTEIADIAQAVSAFVVCR